MTSCRGWAVRCYLLFPRPRTLGSHGEAVAVEGMGCRRLGLNLTRVGGVAGARDDVICIFLLYAPPTEIQARGDVFLRPVLPRCDKMCRACPCQAAILLLLLLHMATLMATAIVAWFAVMECCNSGKALGAQERHGPLPPQMYQIPTTRVWKFPTGFPTLHPLKLPQGCQKEPHRRACV